MIYNRKRHLILGKLIERRNESFNTLYSDHNKTADDLGLDFNKVESILNVTNTKRELILSELYINEEIVSFNLYGENGCFVTDYGVTSYANKKYLKKNEDVIINWLKNFVQIVIPVLALVITYISLTTKMDSLKTLSDKELREVKNIMQNQKERIELLESKTKILPNRKTNDSL
jgi:hypothetical protein